MSSGQSKFSELMGAIGIIRTFEKGWLYDHEPIPEAICCKAEKMLFEFDKIGLLPALITPTGRETIQEVVYEKLQE